MTRKKTLRTFPATARRSAGLSARGLICLMLAFALTFQIWVAPAAAQGKISFLRDAETEELLRDYIVPIYRAAGVGGSRINVYLVNDRQFNAFVADGRRVFVNVGALMQSATPNEIIGVLAHETGHMAGGHLARLHDQMAGAQAVMVLSMLLAAGAIAAGGGQAGQAVLLGGQQLASRNLLRYQRGEEQAADRAGMAYLAATQQSGRGMIEVFRKFADQDLFGSQYADPYAQSHPTPRDRIESLEHLAKESPYYDRKDPPDLQYRHDLMRAKLSGYLNGPGTVLRDYPSSDRSVPAQYARTVMMMRQGKFRDALSGVDRLISQSSSYAYFHELKGDILIQAGRPAEAIGPYRRALDLKPNEGLLRASYAKAMVTANDQSMLPTAISELRKALGQEPDHTEGWMQLAIAYGRTGQRADADLASAQAALVRGDNDTAKLLAERAQRQFKPGSPGWLRADDIVKYKPKKN
ncbi:MAG: M48 family metalloprotease [Flavobacteriaceae bacterium]